MTPIKLAMLALALVALVAGALIVKHDATVGGVLLAVGGKLVGLTFPEIGAKKDPPASGSSEADDASAPPPSIRPPGGMDAEFRIWNPRVALAFALLLTLMTMQLGCPTARPPCDESKLRAIDETYVTRVIAVCLAKYASKEDCPEWPAIQATHQSELKAACPP